ncbi:MAG: response regulator [Acidobacteriota bacterium]|jgi:CheY-like chemotaxis protein
MRENSEDETKKVLEGRKILVVDDEPDALTFIATVLEDHGAIIHQATDGDQALDMLAKETFDLMTLDLAMPGKNGVDVYIELRENSDLPQLPVCIITGRPEMRKLIYERQTISPPEGYMSKPVNEKTLLMNIRKILEVRHKPVAAQV